MNVEVLTGPPGCGKSYDMRQEAIQNPGLYLFAFPSLPLLREQVKAFQAEAPTSIEILEAHSEARGSGSVQSRLERNQAYLQRNGLTHAVMLITHEGMMGADLGGFADWHVRIDESPNTIQSNKVRAPASADMLKGLIAIAPIGSHGWGEIRLLSGKQGWRPLSEDDLLRPLSEMLKQAARRHGVFVDTVEWKDSFGWCSIWPLGCLAHCKSVKIAGASYPVSLGAIVALRWEGGSINFKSTVKVMTRTKQPTVRIHYFTQSHEGTTKLWDTRIGISFIRRVCDFLVAKEPNIGFWAANEVVEKLLYSRLHGEPIPVKAAGLNQFDDRTSCAMIYSSKPLTGDKPAQALFGINDDEILRAREEEDILQFVMRGAIRRPDFGGDYDIYLYSKRQAELVQQKLIASGVGQQVMLIPEPDAGIMDANPKPATSTKEVVALTPEASAAKEEAAREKDRQRNKEKRDRKAIAEGREPGLRGRPSSSSSKKP